MPKQEGQKSKLVTLLRILEQRTDENHRLNVPQLVQLLENQGILAERKSIYSDIDTLRSLGYDIQLQRGRGGGYWMASRAFELSELKLLVDAVQSSSVISARTSKRIIHKLEAGICWINAWGESPAEMPVGGYKQSGVGRETHKMALSAYQQTKNLLVSYGTAPLGLF